MSTTDNAFSATIDPINTPKAPLKQRWWHILDNWKVGIIPGLFRRQAAERYRRDGGDAGLFRLCLR